MHTATVVTNRQCNQNCGFCNARRPYDDRALIDPAAVRARIHAAVRDGAREVVLSGGEPLLRRDLAALVAYARRAGAEEIVLETNAALLSTAAAAGLKQAGLHLARVHMPVWGDAADAISRDEGGFERTLAGLRALAAAGIPIEIATPIVRDNLHHVADIPPRLAESGLPIEAIVVGVPVDAPDATALAPLAEAVRAIETLEAAARKLDLRVRFEPRSLIPPCLFTQPLRIAHLFSLTQGGAARPNYKHLADCSRCVVRDRCPGVPQAVLGRDPPVVVRPIQDDRARRRLSIVTTVAEQIERELVARDVRRRSDGSTIRENIVRVNFHCNQACTFCFVSTHLPPASNEAIEAAIAEIAELRGVLTLSGGEPTLNPKLIDYVRMGKRLGVREIELQTNAMRLGDAAFTRSLVEAGVDVAFVSLHASNAEISDFVTQAPGTFAKTVAGIDELAKTNVALRLNFVFCEANYADFPAYIEMVAARWPRASVTVSFVAASTDLVPKDRAMIPRYTDVMPHLAKGIHAARKHGIVLTGFESMCGIPLCQVPDDLTEFFALPEIGPGVDRGEFRKPEVCSGCALDRRCFGIRRGYADLYGISELVPVPEGVRSRSLSITPE